MVSLEPVCGGQQQDLAAVTGSRYQARVARPVCRGNVSRCKLCSERTFDKGLALELVILNKDANLRANQRAVLGCDAWIARVLTWSLSHSCVSVTTDRTFI